MFNSKEEVLNCFNNYEKLKEECSSIVFEICKIESKIYPEKNTIWDIYIELGLNKSSIFVHLEYYSKRSVPDSLSYPVPIEYLYLPNWKEIHKENHIKKKELERIKEEEKVKEAQLKRDKGEYSTYLRLAAKYGNKSKGEES